MMKKLTARNLLKAIKEYKKTYTGNYSLAKHLKREELQGEAGKILMSYETGNLQIDTGLQKAMALYISAFSTIRESELLSKLQSEANFNVADYIKNSKKSFWHRVLKIDDDRAMSARKLKKECAKYAKYCARKRKSVQYMEKVEEMQEQAGKYASKILSGDIVVPAKDLAATQEYFKIVCGQKGEIYEGTEIWAANEKLKKAAQNQRQAPEISAKAKTKQPKPSFWSKLKNKVSAWKNKLKTAAVVAGIGLLGFAGFKTAGKINIAPQKKNIATKNIAVRQNLGQKSPEIKPEAKTKQNPAKVLHAEKIWKNYYDNTLGILISEAKRDMLYKQIERQVSSGNFALPQNISVEKAAYAKVMYEQYGLKSSLEQAFKTSKKLNQAQQDLLIKDILAVGDKGLGAKKMAMAASKRLTSFSRYNSASSQQQKQHVKNLKQLKQMRTTNQI